MSLSNRKFNVSKKTYRRINQTQKPKNYKLGRTKFAEYSLYETVYNLSIDQTIVDIGDMFTITLETEKVNVGTLIPYTISGVELDYIDELNSDDELKGNFVVNDSGITSISFTVSDNIELDQLTQFVLSLDNGRSSVSTLLLSSELTVDKTTVKDGGDVTFTLTTYGLEDGTQIPYTIGGSDITADDLNLPDLTGSFYIYNGTSSVNLSIGYDVITDDYKTFTLSLNGSSIGKSVTIVEETYTLSGPSEIDEGQSFTVTLTAEYVDIGKNIPYTITGVTSGDISGAPLNGQFIVGDVESVTFNIMADELTEGLETFNLSLDGGYDSISVDIQDTSIGVGYDLSVDKLIVDETTDNQFTVTLNTQNVTVGENVLYTITGVTSRDISEVSLTGEFIVGDVDSITFNISEDFVTEGLEAFILSLDNGYDSISVDIQDTSNTTYTLSGPSEVDEGDSFTINLMTTGLDEGDLVNYTVEGISSSDMGESLGGSFVIDNNNTAQVQFNVTADQLSEGNETFKLVLDTPLNEFINVTINDTSVETYDLKTDKTSVNEGDQLTVTINTQGVGDGVIVPYVIDGANITPDDLGLSGFEGEFIIYNNTDSITFTITEDVTTEGYETFSISLNNGKAVTDIITIIDSSKTKSYTLSGPSEVDEGDSFTITLTTENIDNDTSIPYEITGISSSDVNNTSLTGEFIVGVTNFRLFNVTADQLSEGNETFTITLTDIGVSKVVTINDTSNSEPVFTLTSLVGESVDEGSNISILLRTQSYTPNASISYTIIGIDEADIEQPLNGYFETIDNVGVVTFNVKNDYLTELGSEIFELYLDDYPDSRILVTINDTSLDPDFVLTSSVSSVSSVDEGSSFSIYLDAVGIPNQQVAYTVGGSINSADIEEPMVGVFNLFDGHAEIEFNVSNDYVSEGSETFTLSLTDYTDKNISVVINDTSKDATFELSAPLIVSENGPFTVTLTTANYPNGPVPYTISGTISEGDITEDFNGEFYIIDGTSEVTFNVSDDWTEEGSETFILSLDNGVESITITIDDTSNKYPDWVPQLKQEFGIQVNQSKYSSYSDLKQEFGIAAQINPTGYRYVDMDQEFGVDANLSQIGFIIPSIKQEFGIMSQMYIDSNSDIQVASWNLNLNVDFNNDIYIEMVPLGEFIIQPQDTLDVAKHLIRVGSPTSNTSTLHFEGNSLVNVNGFTTQELLFFYNLDQGLNKAARFIGGDTIDGNTQYDLISTTHVIVANEDTFYNGFSSDQNEYVGFKLILDGVVYYGWILFKLNSSDHTVTIIRIKFQPETEPLIIPT